MRRLPILFLALLSGLTFTACMDRTLGISEEPLDLNQAAAGQVREDAADDDLNSAVTTNSVKDSAPKVVDEITDESVDVMPPDFPRCEESGIGSNSVGEGIPSYVGGVEPAETPAVTNQVCDNSCTICNGVPSIEYKVEYNGEGNPVIRYFNNTTHTITFGKIYTLLNSNGDEVPFLEGTGFEAIAMVMEPGAEHSLNVNIGFYFGDIPKGDYTVVHELWCENQIAMKIPLQIT